MPDTGNVKDYLELPPRTFSILTLKTVTWRTYLISFTVQYCFLFRFFLYRACFTHGTMINWSTLIKKLMQMYVYRQSLWEFDISIVHMNGI